MKMSYSELNLGKRFLY